MPISDLPQAAGNAARGTFLSGIRDLARSLLIPSAAVYYELNQERLRAHEARLAELERLLGSLREESAAAATSLLALNSAPTTSLHSYADLVGGTS